MCLYTQLKLAFLSLFRHFSCLYNNEKTPKITGKKWKKIFLYFIWKIFFFDFFHLQMFFKKFKNLQNLFTNLENSKKNFIPHFTSFPSRKRKCSTSHQTLRFWIGFWSIQNFLNAVWDFQKVSETYRIFWKKKIFLSFFFLNFLIFFSQKFLNFSKNSVECVTFFAEADVAIQSNSKVNNT